MTTQQAFLRSAMDELALNADESPAWMLVKIIELREYLSRAEIAIRQSDA